MLTTPPSLVSVAWTRHLMAPGAMFSPRVTRRRESFLQWSRWKICRCRLGTRLMVTLTTTSRLLAVIPVETLLARRLLMRRSCRLQWARMSPRLKTLKMVPPATWNRQSWNDPTRLTDLWAL